MITNMVHSVTLLAVAINYVKLKSSVHLEYLPTTIRLRHYPPAWNFKQYVLLCPRTVHNSLLENWTADLPNGAIYKSPA